MTAADHNEQGRRGRWPYPDDDTTIARKIAMMYRAALGIANRNLRDQCDATAASFGQTWMIDKPQIVDPDQEVTTEEAAELVHTTANVIRKWACAEHPEHPDRPLLPRTGWRGRERTYLAVNVLAAAVAVRRARHTRTTT